MAREPEAVNPEVFLPVGRQGLKDRGFRLVINGGGAQIVPHLHIHLMGPIGKTASL